MVTLLQTACDGAVVGWGRWADGGTWPLRALVSAAAPALRACRLGGLRSAAGSCGALRLLPWVTLGSIGVVCTIRGIMFAKF